jgi:large subunit ribosomal protein L2
VPATVERLEYDPNRTAFIALIKYDDGELSYILAPQRLRRRPRGFGRERPTSSRAMRCRSANMPVGTIVHNVEMKPGKGGQMARSAGAYAQLVGRDQGYGDPAPELRRAAPGSGRCMATVGAVSNPDHGNINLGKAGRSALARPRPHVRGVAMNPVDHPHGGGEGRTSGGRHPVTPWGKPTKGKRTRSNKSTDKFIMRSRHQRKKKKGKPHGTFSLERPVRRRLSSEEGREGA